MESLSKLVLSFSSLASLAWPAIFFWVIREFREPLKKLVESMHYRKLNYKNGSSEFTLDELSPRAVAGFYADHQIDEAPQKNLVSEPPHVLWVDDHPGNINMLVASLKKMGFKVDTAVSTKDGIEKFKANNHDIVISDLGRQGERKAGINLAKEVRILKPDTPFFIFCGTDSARDFRDEALNAGINQITSSGRELLNLLRVLKESYPSVQS